MGICEERFFGVSESGEPLAGYLWIFSRHYRDVESKGFNSACFQPNCMSRNTDPEKNRA